MSFFVLKLNYIYRNFSLVGWGMIKRIIFILITSMFFSGCESEQYDETIPIENNVQKIYKLVKVNSEIELNIETNNPVASEFPITYLCDQGTITDRGGKTIFNSPSKPGIVNIHRLMESEDKISNELIYTVLVYKQFIVFKADDLMYTPGRVISTGWDRYINYLKLKNIKGSVGIVCNSLEKADDRYYSYIRDLNNSGVIEFWNHGYDHIVNRKNEYGEKYCEFRNTDYAFQKSAFENAQRIVKEKAGFTMRSFGAPGNAIDENTLRVINGQDEVKVWMYGNPESKRCVLKRKIDFEYPFGDPDLNKFMEVYDENEDYYVLQLHPNMWTYEEYVTFTQLTEFLISQDVTFVNPYELYVYTKDTEWFEY